MQLISSILFGISANADSFVIGVSYGLKKVHIPFSVNFIISFITFAGTLFSIGLGQKIGYLIPAEIANISGSALLILLGLYYFIGCYIKKEPQEKNKLETADIALPLPLSLSLKEGISVSLALTLNNMGMGIGASIAGIPLFITSLLSFVFSFAFLHYGNKLGKSPFLFSLSKFAEPLSGLLMIFLGLWELLS